MKIKVGEEECDRGQIGVNQGMNFGQMREAFGEAIPYQLHLLHEEWIPLIEDEFHQTRDEIKADDEDQQEESEFTPTRYADLRESLSHPEALAGILHTYLARELISKLFTDTGAKGFIINSVDQITVEGDGLLLKGRALSRPKDD